VISNVVGVIVSANAINGTNTFAITLIVMDMKYHAIVAMMRTKFAANVVHQ